MYPILAHTHIIAFLIFKVIPHCSHAYIGVLGTLFTPARAEYEGKVIKKAYRTHRTRGLREWENDD